MLSTQTWSSGLRPGLTSRSPPDVVAAPALPEPAAVLAHDLGLWGYDADRFSSAPRPARPTVPFSMQA